MKTARRPFRRIGWGLVASAAVVAGGCFRRARTEPPLAPPPRPIQQMPVTGGSATQPAPLLSVLPSTIEVPEPYIESLIAVDSDVRLVLQRIAEIGKLELIIPGSIRKTISVHYVHVPVSIALKDVLSRSGLQLGTTTSARLPFDTVTVFYRLPTSVDSLSVDGIMRRFGVSRELADLIVKSRRP